MDRSAQLSLVPAGSTVIRHQPQKMRAEQAKADAIIGYAKKMQDWPLLEEAVTAKLEEQQEFVRWWDENVGVGRGGDGSNQYSKGAKNSDLRSLLSRPDAERLTGILQQQVSRWRKRLADVGRYRDRMIQAARRAAELRAAANHRAEGTGENEWFTPAEYIEAARVVLEEIDLDPASNPIAQEEIKANQYFTRADDGLRQEWHGRVWLNPPYARGEIGPFVNKLVVEINAGHVSSAILLTHNYTDTEWFHHAASVMQAICFTRGRVKFIDDAGDICAPTQGQAFFYYGPNDEEFNEIFCVFGLVMSRYALA